MKNERTIKQRIEDEMYLDACRMVAEKKSIPERFVPELATFAYLLQVPPRQIVDLANYIEGGKR